MADSVDLAPGSDDAAFRQLKRDFLDVQEQFAATSGILTALGRAGADPSAILDSIVERARSLCGADASLLYLLEDGVFELSRVSGAASDEFIDYWRQHPSTMSTGRASLLGRVALDRRIQQIPDVLTDAEFFGGSADDLRAARAAVGLPVLRKDFTVGERDVCDARLMGADCVLLIAAAMEPAELRALHALAREVGLDALVEIHDERELEHALAAEATMVGVNQRDLVTFEVDHARALRMAGVIPVDVVRIAESGVRGPDDAHRLWAAGYHAVLVGETLVTSPDPAATIRELRGSGRVGT